MFVILEIVFFLHYLKRKSSLQPDLFKLQEEFSGSMNDEKLLIKKYSDNLIVFYGPLCVTNLIVSLPVRRLRSM